MEIDYRILNLYKTKQYDECLKLCAVALKDRNDRMIEFIQMRAMTIQAKIAGNGYEEVEYFPQQDELSSTSIAKTPRPGTTFQREVRTAQTHVRPFILLEPVYRLRKILEQPSFVFYRGDRQRLQR